jgi:hypothetical protein
MICGAFLFLARVTRKNGRVVCGTFDSHLFYTGYSVIYLLEGHSDVLCRITARQIPDNFIQFIRLYVEGKKVDIFLSEEFLYGVVVHYTFSVTKVLVAAFQKRNFPLITHFSFLWRLWEVA